VRATAELGIEDMQHVFTDEELVRGDAIVVADRRLRTAICCAACATSPTPRARTRS